MRSLREIRNLSDKLAVEHCLESWGYAVEHVAKGSKDAAAFLLLLDASDKSLMVTSYKSHELSLAYDAYLNAEKETADHPERQAVLVSVESIADLREAYPNYFLDTTAFLEAMKTAIRARS